MKKSFLLSSITLLLFNLMPVHHTTSRLNPEQILPTFSPTDRSIYKDGLIPEYQNILNELPYASMYELKFNIADDMSQITGSETVIYTNAEDIELKEIKFRLFANVLGGEMHVDEVHVNGEIIIPNYTLDDSLLTVPLKQPLQPRKPSP